MKDAMLMPCATWMKKLAVRYPDDLSYADRIALNKHLASCPACAAIHSAYQAIGVRISSLPTVEPLSSLPHYLLQHEEGSVRHEKVVQRAFPDIVGWLRFLPETKLIGSLRESMLTTSELLQHTVVLSMVVMSVVYSRTYWLNALERLSIALAHLHPRVHYASSGNHHFYALQGSDDSPLWDYKKSDVFFSSPVKKNGAPYLSSFDAQMFMFGATLRLRPCSDSFLWKQ